MGCEPCQDAGPRFRALRRPAKLAKVLPMNDILAGCKKAKELGGMVAPGFPFNLPDGAGAIALVVDPVGHAVGMYSRTPLPPAPAPAK